MFELYRLRADVEYDVSAQCERAGAGAGGGCRADGGACAAGETTRAFRSLPTGVPRFDHGRFAVLNGEVPDFEAVSFSCDIDGVGASLATNASATTNNGTVGPTLGKDVAVLAAVDAEGHVVRSYAGDSIAAWDALPSHHNAIV